VLENSNRNPAEIAASYLGDFESGYDLSVSSWYITWNGSKHPALVMVTITVNALFPLPSSLILVSHQFLYMLTCHQVYTISWFDSEFANNLSGISYP
jgi:hypothetical protein